MDPRQGGPPSTHQVAEQSWYHKVAMALKAPGVPAEPVMQSGIQYDVLRTALR